MNAIDVRYEIDFTRYFSNELDQLQVMQDDGLVELDDATIRINPRGRLLVRNICSVFDAYLQTTEKFRGYSKAI
jgi:oxygen-independent coproporphyrinogen-3 oxidase